MENQTDLAPRFRELFDLCTVSQLESAISFLSDRQTRIKDDIIKIAMEKRP